MAVATAAISSFMLNISLAVCTLLLLCTWLMPFSFNALSKHSFTLRASIGAAVSVGIGTLLFYGLGLLIPISPISTLGLFTVLGVLGFAVEVRRFERHRTLRMPASPFEWACLLCLLLVLLVVGGHVTYYPFIGDDTLNRYALTAQEMLELGRLNGYNADGYPAWLPTSFAAILQFDVLFEEQLAKLIPFLYAVLSVTMTFALATRWFGRQAAWLTVLVLATTPLYIKWSGFAYLDIPTALYFLIAAYSIDMWVEKQRWGWAALAGIVTGLAMWIKQSGLAILPSLAVIMLWQLIIRFDRKQPRITMHIIADGILLLVMSIVFGGWWYVRNAIIFGSWQEALATPPAFYTEQAARTFIQLIPFVSNYADFGTLSAAIYLIGCAGIIWLWRQQKIVIVWLWIVPFLLLWWLNFSYDARFLVTVLPFYAMLSGAAISHLIGDRKWSTTLQAGVIVSVLALTLLGIYEARLGGLVQWVRQPTATYAERLTRAKTDLYPTVEYLQSLPGSPRIFSTDGRLEYYLGDEAFDYYYLESHADLAEYDYVVIGSWIARLYRDLGRDDLLATQLQDRTLFGDPWYAPEGGLAVYPVLHP